MKKKIFLFCNNDYGRQFIRTFKIFAQQHPEIDCVLVFSRRAQVNNRLRKLKRIMQLYFEVGYFGYLVNFFLLKNFHLMMVENVNLSNFFNQIPEESLGFVAGFNQIFDDSIIHRFSTLLNFHPSLLPYYRGAIPSYWVIKNNEQISGFTVHQITTRIDSGEIIYQEIVSIDPGINEHELDQKIASAGNIYFGLCLNAGVRGEPFLRKVVEPAYQIKENYTSSIRT